MPRSWWRQWVIGVLWSAACLAWSLLPAGHVIFRVAFLAMIAALIGLYYVATRSTEVYILMLFMTYMCVQQLISKTLYGWVDMIYFRTFGRNDPKAAKYASPDV
jgi:hypothetical protein